MTNLIVDAMRVYDEERKFGSDNTLPSYELDGHQQPPVTDFLESLRSHADGDYLKSVEIKATGQDALLIVSIVVTSLKLIRCPNEDASTKTEIVYYDTLDWVGTGWILERENSEPQVINHVWFVIETNDGDPNKVTAGNLQFIDAQPRGY